MTGVGRGFATEAGFSRGRRTAQQPAKEHQEAQAPVKSARDGTLRGRTAFMSSRATNGRIHTCAITCAYGVYVEARAEQRGDVRA